MSDYITKTDDDDEETKGSSSVNRNNSFPDDILNITKFPTFMMHAVAEHFYTTLKFKIFCTVSRHNRPTGQDYMEYMVAKMIQPYYPEAVSEFKNASTFGRRINLSISGTTFFVPLKKYIKGLYVFISLSSEITDRSWRNVTYTMTFVGRGHEKFAERFNDTYWAYYRGDKNPSTKDVTVTRIMNTGDDNCEYIPARDLSTVIMDEETKISVLNTLKRFSSDCTREFYRGIGEPWHYNLLLYGEPGTGKTSFVTALASVLEVPLLKVDASYLSNYGSTNSKLSSLLNISNGYGNCIILIDEVDLYTYNRQTTMISDERDQKQALLSSLLDFLDNVTCGHIVVLCTNHIGRLDPALIRNGRINQKIKFDLWNYAQFSQKLKQNHITEEEFLAAAGDNQYSTVVDDVEKFYPSTVSDICKTISIERFWNQDKN